MGWAHEVGAANNTQPDRRVQHRSRLLPDANEQKACTQMQAPSSAISSTAAHTRQRLCRQLPQALLPVPQLGAQQVPGHRLEVLGEAGHVGSDRQVGLPVGWVGRVARARGGE